ncbi:MAG TPA: Rieske (2Fe-2S) protein [Devosiaceae bacterium]|jgi:3-phenylpropionate/trans-cinnamate dioxygenase ferredoxin subunit
MNKYVVANVDEFPASGRLLVHVKGRPIVIFHLDDQYYALFNRCPHQGGSLCEGHRIGLVESPQPGQYEYSRAGEIIRCPWHGWEFDIRTGLSRCRPKDLLVRQYPLNVEDGETLDREPDIKGVETFDIQVDGNYLVITI